MSVLEKLKLVARKARLVRTDDSKPVQHVQVEMIGNEGGDLPRLQNYGMTSNADGTGLGVCLTVNGHRIVVALDDPDNRPTGLEAGEVKVWHRNGDFIHLKNGNEIHIKGGSKVFVETQTAQVNAATRADVTSPNIKLVASEQVLADTPLLRCTGEIQDRIGTLTQIRQAYDIHQHTDSSGDFIYAPSPKMQP